MANTPGFWGPNLLADITLVVQILFYLVLCAGVVAQLQQKYKWHDRLQIPVVVLNVFFIAFVMIPTFGSIAGELPGGLNQTPTLVATVHAVLGTIAQGLAIYCLLAGLNILPRKIGVLRYWMWGAFTAWTVTIIFGISVYLLFYGGSPAAAEQAGGEPVSEHAEAVVTDETAPAPATEETVAEHAEEAPPAPTEEPTQPPEAVAEHAEEPAAPEPTEPPAPAEVPTEAPQAPPEPVGQVIFRDGNAHSDLVTLQAEGVTAPAEGSLYELWLTGPEVDPFSGGQVTVEQGRIDYSFQDPEGRPLYDLYNAAFISLEPANDSDPAPSETIAYQGDLPPAVMQHVRHVATSFPGSPDGDGLAFNALANATQVVQLADIQQQAVADNDLETLLIHAESTINVIEGAAGPNFGDSDGNGTIFEAEDQFGLLGFGDNVGYLQGAADHAALARQAEGATENVALHAGHVEISAANAIDWATQIRDLALQVVQVGDAAAAAQATAQMAELAPALLEGVDANGNGQVEPVPGEGGVRTMYEHGQLMGGIQLFAVDEQAAAPAEQPLVEDASMDAMIDEHVEEMAVVEEPEFAGQAVQAQWQPLTAANAGPGARYEHAMQYNAAVNQLFVFGGRNGSQVFNDVWAFDLESNTWRQLAADSPAAPPARYSTVMMVDEAGQNLYVATGHGPGGVNFNDVWRLDLVAETWTEVTPASGPAPEPRYGNPGGNIGDNLIVTHGFGATRYDDTWQFNPQSGQWEEITPEGTLPLRRCLFAATPVGDNLVMHGGCSTPDGPCFRDDAWILDTQANVWREILSDVKPVGRQYHTLTTGPAGTNQVILFGGQDQSRAPRNDLWFLNLESGAWQLAEAADSPGPRYNHAAAWVPQRGMVVYGGRNDEGGLAELWLLTVPTPATEAPTPAPQPTSPPPSPTPAPQPTPTPELVSEHDGE